MDIPAKRNRKRQSKIIINIFGSSEQKKPEETKSEKTKIIIKDPWFKRFLAWVVSIIILFLKWLWSHPKKLISAGLAALLMWLYSFLPFKLPNLPFLPKLPELTKQTILEVKKEQPTNSTPSTVATNKPVEQTITNTITQTNIVTQTNYATETKYITNFVTQPIVVTNTIFKEVPVTVTNVLIIKSSQITNAEPNNKNSVINGPAFYFTEDFNTLLQNQQQNPVRSKPLN